MVVKDKCISSGRDCSSVTGVRNVLVVAAVAMAAVAARVDAVRWGDLIYGEKDNGYSWLVGVVCDNVLLCDSFISANGCAGASARTLPLITARPVSKKAMGGVGLP